MRMFLYTVFDTSSGIHDRPFCAFSDQAAMRSFGDIATDPGHPVGKHPEDFSLFRIGDFDDNKGMLKGEAPECLCTALELVSQRKRNNGGELGEQQIMGVMPDA